MEQSAEARRLKLPTLAGNGGNTAGDPLGGLHEERQRVDARAQAALVAGREAGLSSALVASLPTTVYDFALKMMILY